jgi:acyl dehydratase
MAVEQFPVETGHVMMFARAIGDPNPIYFDAEYAADTEAGAITAPLTFATASAQFDPEYPLRPKYGEPWRGSGRDATGRPSDPDAETESGRGSSLHAEQSYEYHRPLLVGDVLTASTSVGETWTKNGRSGILQFTEMVTEYRDSNGEVVITGRAVAVLTEPPQ